MRLLLDTHALVWWIKSSAQLSATAHSAIANESSDIFVSIGSGWEIAIKVGR